MNESDWVSIEDELPGLNWPCLCKTFDRSDRELPGRLIQITVGTLAWVGEKTITIGGVSHWRYQEGVDRVEPRINWAELIQSDMRDHLARGSSDVNVMSGNPEIA